MPGLKTAQLITSNNSDHIGWIDVNALELSGPPAEFFHEHAGVVLAEGQLLGRGYEDFVRMVFATPRAILGEALEAMGDAVGRQNSESRRQAGGSGVS